MFKRYLCQNPATSIGTMKAQWYDVISKKFIGWETLGF